MHLKPGFMLWGLRFRVWPSFSGLGRTWHGWASPEPPETNAEPGPAMRQGGGGGEGRCGLWSSCPHLNVYALKSLSPKL